MESGGPPYFLFFLCGTTTWVLFERSLLFVTRSLEQNRKLITKVYFPRLILPMSAVAPGLMYLGILLLVMIGTVIYYFRKEGLWYITLRPELLAAVARAGVAGRIHYFQLADWTTPLPEGVLNGRGQLGTGSIDLRAWSAMLDEAGYEGPVEVELFNDALWARDGVEVLEETLDRFLAV